jgi:hypothetical protein
MEDMRSVLMNVNACLRMVAGKTIAADMVALFDNQNTFPGLFNFVREDSAEKTGANHNIIVHLMKTLSFADGSAKSNF